MKAEEVLEGYPLLIILCGMAMGTIARFVTVRIDGRQVPSYPNGLLIHAVTGFIAAALGSVAIPALLNKDFTAVTFLALAVQHFRDVRKQEKESLEDLEDTEFAERGKGYIDGISKTYEARSYISLLTALGTVLVLTLLGERNPWFTLGIGIAVGSLLIYIQVQFTKGKRVGDICDIKEGQITVRDGVLYVDGSYVADGLGTTQAQKLFEEEGVAVVVKPREEKHRLTIEHLGQRKAMLYDAIRSYGVKQFQFAKRSFSQGYVVIAFVPILRDVKGIMDSIRATPILESGRKRRYTAGKGD
jgi:hypothetical protein